MQAYELNGKKFRVTTKWTNDLGDAVEAVASKYYGRSYPQGSISSLLDWVALGEIVRVYERFFPKEIKNYLKLTAGMKSEWGYLEDKTTKKGGDLNTRQLGIIPFHLVTLISVVWPRHKYNRSFNNKFYKTFKRFATAEKI
jgi:hypothetical protein